MGETMRSERISVVGAGRMGLAIAQVMATEGCTVNLVSRHASTLDQAIKDIRSNLLLLQKLGRLGRSVEEILCRISLVEGISEAICDCDFLFESLPEEPEIKKSFLTKVDPYLRDETVVASSTSTINLKTFKGIMTKPSRLLVVHWLNPAFIIPLVEIAVGEETSVDTAERMKSFLEQIGKIPILIKDSPGFVVPRIQAAAMNEAVRILEEGVASAEDIDTAMKGGFGFRLCVFGLLEFIDLGGLDILYYADQFLYSTFKQEHFRAPQTVQQKMKRGEIGPKTGRGFYDYAHTHTGSLFETRYRGFFELLDLINSSTSLTFGGGISLKNGGQSDNG
jgi:3-hydroxybutyryl-CoA dehydrogenase